MRRRDDQQVRAALRDFPAPGESRAEERGWASSARHSPSARRSARRGARERAPGWRRSSPGSWRSWRSRPPGAEVRDWIADAIEVGEEDARPVLGSLPAGGSVLVESNDGAWVLNDDGSRRNLGDYAHVTWSPNGLYVGAAEGRELFALTPQGDVRWSLTAPATINSLDWSSDDGFRVAYVAGRELRIVAGDGTPAGDPQAGQAGRLDRDRLAAGIRFPPLRNTSSPTWTPTIGSSLEDTDTRQVLWRSEPVPAPCREPAMVGRRGTAPDRSRRLRLAGRRPRRRAVQGARRNRKRGHARGRRPADRRRPSEPCRQGRAGAGPGQPRRGPGTRSLPDQPGQGRSRVRHAHVLSRRRVDPAALARGGPVALHPSSRTAESCPSPISRASSTPTAGLRDVPARRRMVLLRHVYA